MNQIQAYQQETDEQSVEKRVMTHAHLVKKIVYHLLCRLPPGVQGDDLFQAGMIGLLEAAKNYKSDRNAKFETYASIRIRGGILDELRRSSWVPRSTQQNMKKITNAIHSVESRTGQEAQPKEIANELGVGVSEYLEMASASYANELFSLQDVPEDHFVSDSEESDPSSRVEKDQIIKKMVSYLNNLPKNEQLVLSFYYSEKLKFKEISEVIGVGEARICQLHAQGLARLQARMKKDLL
jgi:RNA polymerase sigma factor FliA